MKREIVRRATHTFRDAATAATPRTEMLENRLLFSTYTVTTLDDEGGFLAPNGADSFNATTLRAAITAANASAGADTIEFAEDVTGTINLDLALPAIEAPLTLNGPGNSQLTVQRSLATVDRFSIFRISPGATVLISGMTIQRGAGTPGVTDFGQPYFSGGGIYNEGVLSISKCLLLNNESEDGDGGGIYNSGILEISYSRIAGNTTFYGGGAGLANSGSAIVIDSTFENNLASDGGAVLNMGVLHVRGSTFARNDAGLDRSSEGGAIWSDGQSDFRNCTFSLNTAIGPGGAIYNSGDVSLTSCTITANWGNTGTEEDLRVGGIASTVIVKMNNSIVVGNNGGYDAFIDSQSSSNNLIGNGDFVNGRGTNQIGVTLDQLKLGELADNGGPTQTIALLPGSIAVDAGSNAHAVDADGDPLATDQRGDGFARIVGGTVDVGAFEVQSAVAVADGSVSGVVFKDADGNGVQDDGEKAAKAWLVWADLNKDGRLNHSEPRTITNSKGHYKLADLPVGPLVLRVEKRRDAKQTLPPTNKPQVPTIVAGQDTADVNFGVQPLGGAQYAPGTGAVSGVAFNDADGNAVRDAGEAGLGVWLVWADLNQDGRLNFTEPRTITDAKGEYVLYDVPAGAQVLRIERRDGWQQTFPIGGRANIAEVLEGKLDGDRDFGVRPIVV